MALPERGTARSIAGNALQILIVFLVAGAVVWIGWRLVGEDPLLRQAVVWVANVAMLVAIWLELRIRGERWEHLGLDLRLSRGRALVRAILQSFAVLVFALAGFVAGSLLAANFATTSAGADMSGYQYLQGNLPMLLLALVAVYVVSSFGEEVVYRGFLMTRFAEMGKGTRAAWAASVILSAVVFGLVHFDWGFVGVVQTTCMGLALGVSYLLVKRNLWVLVLAHAYLDTVLLVQLYLAPGTSAG